MQCGKRQDNSTTNVAWQDGSIDYTTGADRIASFSQRLDAPNFVFALGAIISSTVLGGGIGESAGTSQASPHVAGAIAILQQASLQFTGSLLTAEQVQSILLTTGERIVDGDDENDNIINTEETYIRINIYNAVLEIKSRSENLGNLTINSDQGFFSKTTVYRFFRADLGVHFYTASTEERDAIAANLPQYTYEGESYIAAPATVDPLTGAKPVYRFLNNDTSAHLYTISETERDYITDNLPHYTDEGIAYYGYQSDRPGTTPLYRFYNPFTDSHFYTPSAAERDAVLTNLPDYQLEGNDGISFFVEPLDPLDI